MSTYRPYRVYRPQPTSAPQVQKRRHLSFRSGMIVSICLLLLVAAFKIDLSAQAHAKAAASAELARRAMAITKFQKQLPGLVGADSSVDYQVAVTDQKLAKSSSYHQNTAADAASTAKLITASLYLNKVEKSQASLNQSINGMPAKQALSLLINRSDDDAWLAFNDYLGHSSLSQYASALGLSSYDVDTNTISAADMNHLITLLDQGKLLNQLNTSLLMGYMQNTNYEDLISPAVNSHFTLYHKVGINNDNVNDTAVIKAPGDTLYITIFTQGNGTYDWPARAQVMQQVTKAAEQAYLE